MTYQQTGTRENPTQGVEKTKTRKTKQNKTEEWFEQQWQSHACSEMFNSSNI